MQKVIAYSKTCWHNWIFITETAAQEQQSMRKCNTESLTLHFIHECKKKLINNDNGYIYTHLISRLTGSGG